MNAEILKGAGIDYDFGVKRFAGRAQLFEKAMSKFPKDGAFFRIRAAYEAGDEERLLAGAHEFKGMCGNIGLTSLYEASDALIRLLRGGGYSPDELSAAYELLEGRYETVYNAVIAAMEDTI